MNKKLLVNFSPWKSSTFGSVSPLQLVNKFQRDLVSGSLYQKLEGYQFWSEWVQYSCYEQHLPDSLFTRGRLLIYSHWHTAWNVNSMKIPSNPETAKQVYLLRSHTPKKRNWKQWALSIDILGRNWTRLPTMKWTRKASVNKLVEQYSFHRMSPIPLLALI
jgi:hypothetical protein